MKNKYKYYSKRVYDDSLSYRQRQYAGRFCQGYEGARERDKNSISDFHSEEKSKQKFEINAFYRGRKAGQK